VPEHGNMFMVISSGKLKTELLIKWNGYFPVHDSDADMV
jgi:hypothetical protein